MVKVAVDKNQELNTDYYLLRKLSIFSGVGDDEVMMLTHSAKTLDFKHGEIIYYEGENRYFFNIVKSGSVKVVVLSSSGKQFTVAVRNVGETFFDIPVYDYEGGAVQEEDAIYEKDSIIAQAVRETKILVIPWEKFYPFLIKNDIIARNIMRLLVNRVNIAYGKIMDLVASSAFQRLIKTLISLSSTYGSELPFSGQELGDMSGTARETTSRLIHVLKRRDIITKCEKRLVIINTQKLQELRDMLDSPL